MECQINWKKKRWKNWNSVEDYSDTRFNGEETGDMARFDFMNLEMAVEKTGVEILRRVIIWNGSCDTSMLEEINGTR